jgi:NTE family protein
MKLRFDPTKKYAVALAGGGARGAYQIGAWRAFEEAGLDIVAVSGTSVGALNGAMMAMKSRALAENLWTSISISQVIDYDDPQLLRALAGDFGDISFRGILRALSDLVRQRGLDVTPLRRLMAENIDEDAVRASDIELFIITYSLTERRELELRAKDLDPGTLHDMLLASAYLLSFRNEPLGGKRYTDGGIADVLPLHVLIENGYKDIIGVRLQGLGIERKVEIPPDVQVTIIEPGFRMGRMLSFDAEKSAQHMKMGYLDAQRALYGLVGEEYYIDQTITERRAYRILSNAVADYFRDMGAELNLRELNERALPRLLKGADPEAGYYGALIHCLEAAAVEAGIEKERVYEDAALIALLKAEGGKYAFLPQIGKVWKDFKR